MIDPLIILYIKNDDMKNMITYVCLYIFIINICILFYLYIKIN